MAAAWSISSLYCARSFSSTWAVGGARAGAATNSYKATLEWLVQTRPPQCEAKSTDGTVEVLGKG